MMEKEATSEKANQVSIKGPPLMTGGDKGSAGASGQPALRGSRNRDIPVTDRLPDSL